MATKAQVKAFISKIAPIVVKTCKSKSKKVLPSVCIAQACCESAYGTTQRMMNANALFGIKVGSKIKYGTAWKGLAYNSNTKECYDGSTMVNISAMFRAYDIIEESVEDYYDMLGYLSRYQKCIGELDPETCITAIKNGGYATDPNYVKTIMSIINTNDLTQYDDCMKSSSASSEEEEEDYGLAHKVGEEIKVSSYYRSSTDPISKAIIRDNSGTILKVKPGTQNPYCFGNPKNNVAIGWCNDGDIRSFSTSSTSTKVMYKVKSGDTLSEIAHKYNTTVSKIVSANKSKYPKISANYIVVGWTLDVG